MLIQNQIIYNIMRRFLLYNRIYSEGGDHMDQKYHTEQELIEVYNRNVDMIYRICFSYMKNKTDSEDALSSTFMRYITYPHQFESLEHEKAWFIRTATNVCKDMLKSWWKRNVVYDDKTIINANPQYIDSTLDIVLNLPNKYKTVIYLYYYEGYNSEEIAKIMKKSPSTIRNQLARARKILKRKLGDDYESNS